MFSSARRDVCTDQGSDKPAIRYDALGPTNQQSTDRWDCTLTISLPQTSEAFEGLSHLKQTKVHIR